MIDAPDHAAQERDNRSTGAWLLVALLGIALSVVAGMMSYDYTTAQAEQRFADVVDYVATQSLSYDAFNSAYTTKNLIRVMEIAGEAARDMERDGSVDNAMLEQYADQFNVSALIVTDASGNLVSESSTGDVDYGSLATYLKESPVLEVATHPLKSYTARITLADDSVADIGCVTRQDGEGIVIAVRHQSAKAVASNTLKLQSLLDGYETIDSGNIVIESDGKVVATNAVEPTVLGVFDLPATDVFIVDGIKDRCLAGKVRLVNADGEWYLGTFGKAHKFYVYTYASAQRYFEVAAAVAAGVLVLYGGVIAVVVTVRRRTDRRRLTDLLQQERDYGDKLAKAAREASSANSAKTEFLRRMSHDLRTPINGIRGMVEVGDANADDLQKQTECRSKIWTASGLLLDLANEALDMSRLPFEKCDRSEIPQAVPADAGDGDALQGLRVLLVEDNDLNAEIAQFTLSRAGAIVTHAKDGESAVEMFAASAPYEYDVVLMDIMMPGIDGLEATRRIRALDREDAALTPIIAVSANAFADDRRLSREAGMNVHLSKPVSSQELVEALAHIAADAS